MLTTFVRIMRIALGVALLVLGAAAVIYIIAGSWAFDINIEQVTYWFLFTAVVLVAICVALACLVAVLSLLFGGLLHPFSPGLSPAFGGAFGKFLTCIPFTICVVLVLFILIFLANGIRQALGYPFVEFTDLFKDLFAMLGLQF